ncbi:MAG: CehA/McbA family metallohydrolase [Ardenticatenia bacterium]|nr:CehA/McbA family metallohydrolase [Ardenticatenia bacterium]
MSREEPPPSAYHLCPGVLHIHTTYSDGTGRVSDVAQAAKRAGLRWIIITDHDDLRAATETGWYDGVAVLAGYEITPERNHYLVCGLDEVIPHTLPPAEYVRLVAEKGGLGFVAHPDEQVTHEYTRPFRWDDWSLRGFTGIELWNYMSEWIERYSRRRRYVNYFFPQLVIKGPTPATLAWWDRLAVEGWRPTGVVGADVHATKVRALGRTWEVFPYERVFRTLTDYLVLDRPLEAEFTAAASQILDALRAGRVIMANRTWGEAAGVRFEAHLPDGRQFTVGDEVPAVAPVTLLVHVPRRAHITLYRNGVPVTRVAGRTTLRMTTHDSGHYRVEARRWGHLWILTNHIHLGEKHER